MAFVTALADKQNPSAAQAPVEWARLLEAVTVCESLLRAENLPLLEALVQHAWDEGHSPVELSSNLGLNYGYLNEIASETRNPNSAPGRALKSITSPHRADSGD